MTLLARVQGAATVPDAARILVKAPNGAQQVIDLFAPGERVGSFLGVKDGVAYFRRQLKDGEDYSVVSVSLEEALKNAAENKGSPTLRTVVATEAGEPFMFKTQMIGDKLFANCFDDTVGGKLVVYSLTGENSKPSRQLILA